jgi:pimeloyl-ACP methyl ester carboxylesterase
MRKFLLAFFVLAALPAAVPAVPRAPTVPSADGVPIAYEVVGQGTATLILVHGWSCDRGYWREQIEYLSPQYRLVLVDLAGHGESGMGRKDYTMAAFGADVAAVVDSLGLKDVVLVGHSMGADVVVEAAKLLRGKVAGLVWVDQYESLDKFHGAAEVEAFTAKFRKDFRGATLSFVRGMFLAESDPKLVDRIAKDMSSAPPAVGLSALTHTLLNGPNLPPALAELGLPVVAINADRHPTDHESMMKHGVKAFVIPNSAHFLMLEDPARFNRALDSVVKGFAK